MSEALRLAEALLMGDAMLPEIDLPEAAAELRRLHAENEALRAEVERITNNRDMWQAQCFNQAAAMDQMRIAARKEST